MGISDFSDALAEVLSGVQRLIRRRPRRDLAGPPLRAAQVERLGEDDRVALAAALPALRRLAEGLREEVEGL